MILSDHDIKVALKEKRIIIDPKPDLSVQLGSCSIDLRLGKKFRVFNHSKIALIDPQNPCATEDLMTEITVKNADPFILQPGDFILATTMETITIPDNMLARLEGRSSLGRLGIVVHSTASVFDPGWHGVAVLELGNLGRIPVALYPGMRICSFTFEELSSPADVPYTKRKSSKYKHQNAPLASKISEERVMKG
ncbi:MAG: deoxycytidine triphosphate deaminase, dCTP deaminase [Microgenomates group bacterium GW2011_GWC1_39_12]|nr:MAG: deoxycytidine triphosphate deaminase, dCTP deaminase [Microgenomates group bacterium GW2011_GWC1_39_12]